jgi:hypothetical protein
LTSPFEAAFEEAVVHHEVGVDEVLAVAVESVLPASSKPDSAFEEETSKGEHASLTEDDGFEQSRSTKEHPEVEEFEKEDSKRRSDYSEFDPDETTAPVRYGSSPDFEESAEKPGGDRTGTAGTAGEWEVSQDDEKRVLAEGQASTTCPCGAALTYLVADSDVRFENMFCDRCEKQVREGDDLWECGDCNWCLCLECRIKVCSGEPSEPNDGYYDEGLAFDSVDESDESEEVSAAEPHFIERGNHWDIGTRGTGDDDDDELELVGETGSGTAQTLDLETGGRSSFQRFLHDEDDLDIEKQYPHQELDDHEPQILYQDQPWGEDNGYLDAPGFGEVDADMEGYRLPPGELGSDSASTVQRDEDDIDALSRGDADSIASLD